MNKKCLVVLVGPTAVGKTSTAIWLARHFNTEIISADSRQVYREMKIGTAAPGLDQMSGIRHHFIGSRSVKEYYNASMFEFEVLDLLGRLFKQHNIVIMAGGSGMYIDAVCRGIDDFPTIDPEIRKQLKAEFHLKGMDWLRTMILEGDPAYYKQVDLNNPSRLLKALEIMSMTGRTYSSFLTRQRKERNFDIIRVGLNISREALYANINQRVDEMIKDGLVDEARGLLPFREWNALNTVGYRELFAYFDAKMSLQEAIETIKRNTRHYARRQLTWFNKNRDLRWFEPGDLQGIMEYVKAKAGLTAETQ